MRPRQQPAVRRHIYELALEEATDAGLAGLSDAACPLCREPWLLPDTFPLATDVIRAAR
jgi:hypothetical protein